MLVLDLDSTAQDALTGFLRNKARKLSRHAAFTQADIPDIEQTLRVKLIRASRSYDPKKGDPLGFLRMVVARETRKLIRSQAAICRNPCRVATLSNPKRLPTGEFVIWADSLPENEGRKHRSVARRDDQQLCELRQDTEKLIASLPPNLRQLAIDLQVYSKAELCRRLGISRGKLAHEIAKMKRVAENLDLRKYC